ncbi:MAG: Stp1/IreP family PP2C-type Ser/Thr phosphatase [Myxococcota bacterium]
MRINFWAATDVGHVREHNEDNFLVDKRMNLFVVCDGMGGHAAGEVASAMSVLAVRDVIASERELLARLDENPSDVPTRREVLRLVERAVLDANRQVYQAALDNEKRRGMGTTCCVLLLTSKRGFIAHVGDSRVYLAREGALHQMTEDHSLYNELVRAGKIKPGEPLNLPNKNAVTRAVGVQDFVEVDVMEFDVREHDRFLVCSDGLCGYFTGDDQVLEYMEGDDVQAITERFIDFALHSGGRDNVTALVIDVPQDEDRELITEVIKRSPYFQYLSAQELEGLLELLDKRSVPPHTQLFGMEDDHSDLWIVLDGEVELARHGEVFGQVAQGEYVGELGFIDAAPNEYTASTVVESTLLVLERAKFMRLLRDKPALAVKLLWNFLQTCSRKLRQVPADIAFASMYAAPALADELEDADEAFSDPQELIETGPLAVQSADISERTQIVPKQDLEEMRERDRKGQISYESSVEEHEL